MLSFTNHITSYLFVVVVDPSIGLNLYLVYLSSH